MARKRHLSAPKAIICVGASEGGMDALCDLVSGLPPDLPAAVLVVLHATLSSPSAVPELLRQRSLLPTVSPADGAPVVSGRIYVAPPDVHLLVERKQIALVYGPKENFSRPAIDPLFRSAAQSWGGRAIGVVLSGNLSDGSAGLWTIHRGGGATIVQDPEDAKLPAMPRNAMAYLKPDYRLPAREIGPRLASIVENLPARTPTGRLTPSLEDAAIRNRPIAPSQMGQFGRPTPYICPECGGPLWTAREGPPRMRCHAGHAYTEADLIRHYEEQKEAILWGAVRVLDEQVELLKGQVKEKQRTPLERKAILVAAKKNADCALVVRKLLSQLAQSPATVGLAAIPPAAKQAR